MFQRRGNYCKLLLVMFGLALSECNSNTASQQVKLQVLPTNPIVFNSPLTYTNNAGNQVTLNGPWLKFQLVVNNTSNQPVTIEAVTVSITDNTNPQNPPTVVTLNPTTDDYSTESVTCTFQDYGEFDPGGTAAGNPAYTVGGSVTVAESQYNNTTLFELPASGSTSCPINIPVLYVGSLPTTSTTQTLFSYTVQVQPVGWFGTRTSQSGRFTNYAYFSTQ